jgi:hypothetical protein
MSIRAQIAIQTGPEEWAHTYVHFDGYPEHMLLALAPWTPQAILAAREIRQVTEPHPLNWSVPIVRKTENRRWELRDRSLKRLLLS